MPEKAEAGDVGRSRDAHFAHRLGRSAVEARHRRDRVGQAFARQAAALGRRGENPGADLLGEYERVASLGTRVGDDLRGMDRAGDEEAEFRLLVDDRMAARDGDSGLGANLRGAREDWRQFLGAERLDRPSDEA